MFGNLIESNSHKGDYARKGSFFLGTLAFYALAFLAIGVGSIFAYNTQVENPDLRLVSLVAPADISDVRPTERPRGRQSAGAQNSSRPVILRTPPQIATTDPTFVTVNTRVAGPGPELPPGRHFEIGEPGDGQNLFGGPGSGTGNRSGNGGAGGNVGRIDELGGNTPPPMMKPEPRPPAKTIKISGGPMNGQARYLPKPIYSAIARAARASGVVTVQLLIDEFGKVVSAHAVGGHVLLQNESVRAAYQARFTPTTLSGIPVKVSGVITYNFVLQ